MDLQIFGIAFDFPDRLSFLHDQQSSFVNCSANDNHKWFCFGESGHPKQKKNSDYNLIIVRDKKQL
jgi:hypothetical protein